MFIKSTFGYAFWQGNSPGSWGTDKVPKAAAEAARLDNDGTLRGVERALWEARYVTVYIDDLSLKPTGYRDFAGLSEPARSRLLLHRAWQFIHANPAIYFACASSGCSTSCFSTRPIPKRPIGCTASRPWSGWCWR